MVSKFKNKKKTEEAEVETETEVDNNVALPVRCVAWCFLPGISHVGQTGLLQCILGEGHEEEHQIRVGILSPPAGNFTINWTVGVPE